MYYKDDNTLQHRNIVAISEDLKHDTSAVHLFQSELIIFLKQEIRSLNRIIYFSDGASAQYKNKKNFMNLCFHQEDFGLTAEWHFFATSHGKGPCDGIGGATKRLAMRASLQPGHEPITTPRLLYDWASKNIKNIKFQFFTEKQHKERNSFLEERYKTVKPIRGTLKLHSFNPISKNEAIVKQFSFEREGGKMYITSDSTV